MKLTVTELAKRLGARLIGRGSGQISAVGPVEAADENTLTFVADRRHSAALKKSCAGAAIVAEQIEGFAKPQLVVKNVNKALIESLGLFAPRLKGPAQGIDPAAIVSERAQIAETASVGAGVVIEDGAQVGANSVIRSGCKIGENSILGQNSRLDSNVVVYHNCTIGNSVIIQANSTIGSTGFGYYFIEGAHKLIPHNGSVVIEDFVEIGANCCIDRAKFGETIIGAGTKIDNLVQIAHNVVIGKCCLIAGQVGIAGSCRVGDGVILAGRSGLSDNIEIGDGAVVGAQSVVFSNVTAGQQVFGTPAIEKTKSLRIFGLNNRLPKLFEQLKQLAKRIEKLEAAKDGKD